ncbi:hypothetical protein R3P38DRAFT_2807946 [Favolaschia claudopus]|uniref:Uncharacterized protein n=1 Tax=Favolaschia claudopus TaxID=2862362 RepID=A0AAV9ZHK4_9AGAR
MYREILLFFGPTLWVLKIGCPILRAVLRVTLLRRQKEALNSLCRPSKLMSDKLHQQCTHQALHITLVNLVTVAWKYLTSISALEIRLISSGNKRDNVGSIK